jgi:hypothetical protein
MTSEEMIGVSFLYNEEAGGCPQTWISKHSDH